MIQAVMFITLGFLIASLIGILVAPFLWSRAYRLSRKRLESTLPLSLSEIEATQDQLRASYAVRMRRLETSLAGTKQKAALQLVDNSRLQMQIITLKDNIAELDLKLSERRNAAGVLEQTLTKRVPELEREVFVLKAQLQERSHELQDVANRLVRRDELLEQAERAANLYQDELNKLRQAMEKTGADKTGRRLRRASKWDLDDYRAEYDRLNLELSKMRQQLSQYQDRDAQQVGLIKGELQKLAELILVSAQPKPSAPNQKPVEIGAAKRSGVSDLRRDRPLPWPGRPQQQPLAGDRAAPAVSTQSAIYDIMPLASNEAPKTSPSQDEKTSSADIDKVSSPANNVKAQSEAPSSKPSQQQAASKEAESSSELPNKSKLVQDIVQNNHANEPKPAESLNGTVNDNGSRIGVIERAQRQDFHKTESQQNPSSNPVSDKPFSDARELKALSELMAIRPSAGVESSQTDGSSAIVQEAKQGQILDLKASETVENTQETPSANAQTQLRTLLDRLRGLDEEPAEAKK